MTDLDRFCNVLLTAGIRAWLSYYPTQTHTCTLKITISHKQREAEKNREEERGAERSRELRGTEEERATQSKEMKSGAERRRGEHALACCLSAV